MPVHEDISYDQCCKLVIEYARKEHMGITVSTLGPDKRNELWDRVVIHKRINGMDGRVFVRRNPISLDDYILDSTGSYGLELLSVIEKLIRAAMQ